MINVEKLSAKINPKLVKKRDGGGGRELSYIPGYIIEGILNKLANYQWSRETLDLTQLFARNYKNSRGLEMTEVAYSARVKISVELWDGEFRRDIIKEGCGFGNGQSSINNPSAAYELAIKEAETDAFKRAAKSLGEQFGLELYDKDIDIVRSYEKAKQVDDDFNIAVDEIARMESEDEIKTFIKNYIGNYESDIREAGINRVLQLRAEKKLKIDNDNEL